MKMKNCDVGVEGNEKYCDEEKTVQEKMNWKVFATHKKLITDKARLPWPCELMSVLEILQIADGVSDTVHVVLLLSGIGWGLAYRDENQGEQ